MLIFPPRGFSLFEILVVIAIIAISTTLVSVSFSHNGEKRVFNEAARFRTIIETVSDRAAILQRPMIVVLRPDGYKVKERIHGNWVLLNEGFLSPYHLQEEVRTSSNSKEIFINGMGFMDKGEISFFSIYKKKNVVVKSIVLFDELGRVKIY
jgi:prepilin-type N-terminal cleavage/methylation domain-containing protein